MTREWLYHDKESFLLKLKELLAAGTPPERLTIMTPFHVHEVDHLLHLKPSPLKIFTLIGAAAGLAAGWGLTIYTSLDWPLRTGGKPIVAIPAYVIVAFELTILIGAIVTFGAFLFLGRFPVLKVITGGDATEAQFLIQEHREEDE